MKRNSKFRHGIHKPCERKSIFRTVKDLITPKWLSRLFTSEEQHEPKEPQEEDTRTRSIFGSLKDLLTPSWLTRYITLKPGNINTQDFSKDCKKQTFNRDKQHQNVERSPVNTCNQKNNSRCSDTCFPHSTSIPHTGPREDIHHQQDQMPVQNTGIFSSSQLPLQTGNIDGHYIDNDDNFSNISDYSGCSSGYSSMNPHQPTSIEEKKSLTELNNNGWHNSDSQKIVNWSAQYNTKSLKKSSLTEKSSSGLNLFPSRADESAAILSNRLIERNFHPGKTFGRGSPKKRKWNESCSPSSPHKIPTRQKMQARHVTSSINSNLLISLGAKNMEGTLEKLKTEIEEFHLTSTDNDISLYDMSRKDKCHSVGKESHYSNIDKLSVVSSSTDKESEAQDDCQIGSAGLSSKSDMTSHLNGYSKSSSEFYLTGDSNSSAKFGGKSVLYNNGFIVKKRLTELSERIDQLQSCKYTYSKDLPKQNGSSFSKYYELQPLETEITSEINESTISKEYVVKDKSEVMVKSSDNKSRESSSGDTITCDTLSSSSRLSRTPILGTSETAALASQISETSTQNREISTMAAAIPRTSTPSLSTSWISTSASQTIFGKSLASTSFCTKSETSEVLIGNSNKSTPSVGLPQSTLPINSTSWVSTPTFRAPQPPILTLGTPLTSASTVATSMVSKVTFGNPQTSTFANSMVSIPAIKTDKTSATPTSTSMLSIPAFGTHLTSAQRSSTSLISPPVFGPYPISAPTTSTSLLSTPAFGTHLTSAQRSSTSLPSTPAFGTQVTSAPTTSTSLLSTTAFGTHRMSATKTSTSVALTFGTIDASGSIGTSSNTHGTHQTSETDRMTLGNVQTSSSVICKTSSTPIQTFGTFQKSLAPFRQPQVTTMKPEMSNAPPMFTMMQKQTSNVGASNNGDIATAEISKLRTTEAINLNSRECPITTSAFGISHSSLIMPPEKERSSSDFWAFNNGNKATTEISKLRTTEALNLNSRECPITTSAFGISHSSPIMPPEKERSLQAIDTCTAQKSRSKSGTSEASIKAYATSQSSPYETIHNSVSASGTPLKPTTVFERSWESSSFESSSKSVPIETSKSSAKLQTIKSLPTTFGSSKTQRSTFTKVQKSTQKLEKPESRLLHVSGDDNCDAGIKREHANHVSSTKNIETFIPEYRKQLVSRPIDLSDDGCNVSVVTFDLETTGFGYDADIVQICAEVVQITPQIVDMEFQTFQEYILPTKPINPKASEVTGLYRDGCSLYYKGQKVKTLSKSVGLEKFIKWLPHKAVLVAHNCKSFDSKIIVAQLSSVNLLNEFHCKVFGFSDTLHIFKQKFPGRKSYKQENLVKDILKRSYNAHNAVDDVQLLNILMKNLKVSLQDIVNHSFTVEYIHNYLTEFRCKEARLKTFKPVYMSDEPVMSKSLCERAAKSGLKLGHLHLAISCDDFDGLCRLLVK
ncbi:unnamed protein product [Mytilus edulis]|uniref:Exonuclease domain-containing protein n=1 Tax=Mytilus edulis TaxID=6550 RepID=A0A8S3VPR8_MYTED|nr:unnamed protein product [Mytilus edulis]